MLHRCQIYVFFLYVNLFFSVFVQAEHFSDISNEKKQSVNENKEVSHLIILSSKNTHPLPSSNKSNYEFECYCGLESTGCSYKNGEKHCSCEPGYVQNKDWCEECNCGSNSRGCFFISNRKTCDCKTGYGENDGICQKCNCGKETTGCSFENGKRTCHCSKGTALNGDKCEKCYCGYYSNYCYFENNKNMCSCFDNYKLNYKGECEECNCGFNSENCEFKGYSKECTCNSNYVYVASSGKCERCYCGPMAASCKLTFDKYTRCTCNPGYVAERSRWEMDEKCTLPGPSGWKIATYIESAFFGIIIVICTIHIFCKKTLCEG